MRAVTNEQGLNILGCVLESVSEQRTFISIKFYVRLRILGIVVTSLRLHEAVESDMPVRIVTSTTVIRLKPATSA